MQRIITVVHRAARATPKSSHVVHCTQPVFLYIHTFLVRKVNLYSHAQQMTVFMRMVK